MVFKTHVRVRFSETDLAGWVYYGNYFVYFEVGRLHMYRELGCTYNDMKKDGIFLPMVEAHCEYKHPAQYDDVLEIHTKIVMVREKSLKTEYTIYNEDGVLLVKGYCIQVCVNDKREARPFPDVLKDKLMGALEK
jgi:acyl-CoA thioester hydrolase